MTRWPLCVPLTIFVLLFLTTTIRLEAQQRVVSGKVVLADDGSVLPGVNIVERGTTNGTVTDSNGRYQISVGSNATLVFSFVGFITQEFAVGGESTLDVILQSDIIALQEIVVTGYGTQDKKEITGAVASLKPESFNKGNINDPIQLMQGKIAGVQVVKAGSDPNEPFSVRLRGITTVGANLQPLYVIDGVIGASMANIDPNDIASIDVLKDGSAASIYGTQASSGVILITTKKGKAGKTQVDFNSYVSTETIARTVPVMSRASGYLLAGGGDLGTNTDWIKQISRPGVTVVNNLGVSGGVGNTAWRVSVNLRNGEGILRTSGFDQLNARASLQQSALRNKLRFGFDISTTTRSSVNSYPSAFGNANLINPTAPVYINKNSITGSPYFEIQGPIINPVAQIEQNTNKSNRNIINLSGRIDADLLPGLTGTMTYAIQTENEVTGSYSSKTAMGFGFVRNGYAQRNTYLTSRNIFEGYFSYNKQLNSLALALTGGYSYQQKNSEDYGLATGGFLTDALGYNALSSSQDLTKGGLTTLSSHASPDQKLIGFFARTNFIFKDAYLLSATYRHEGSSSFGADNKWGDFGGVSGAIMLHKLLDLQSVSNLKIRASWGLTGALPPTYGLSQEQFSQSSSYGFNGGNVVPIVVTNLAPNPNLKWEQKRELNLGVDFGLLNNRLTGTFDIYKRNSSDFILDRPIDASQNVASHQYKNLGEIESNGVELSLGYEVFAGKELRWNTSLVTSHVKSVLVKLYEGVESIGGLPEPGSGINGPGASNTYTIRNISGQEVGTMYGPVYMGPDQNGIPIFQVFDSGKTDQSTVIGHGLPKLDLGWANTFSYKRFDFNFLLRGTFGHNLINCYRLFYEPVVPGQVNGTNIVHTQYFNPDLKVAQFSSLAVEEASFVKLDNVTLGYSFSINPNSMISRFRVYLSGNNLFVITNYTGTDPEARLSNYGNPLAPGIEQTDNYFRSRTVTIGLNLTF